MTKKSKELPGKVKGEYFFVDLNFSIRDAEDEKRISFGQRPSMPFKRRHVFRRVRLQTTLQKMAHGTGRDMSLPCERRVTMMTIILGLG